VKESILAFLNKRWSLPKLERFGPAYRAMTLTEKAVFFVFVGLFALSAFSLVGRVNSAFLTPVPAYGGEFTEGRVGSPRFINPVLAVSDTDRDLTSLVYAGLMRPSAEGGMIPDLAERYEISDDGLSYTFFLKDDIYFHDGTPVTADDVEFTIQKTQDPILKSPKRASWDGVTVERVNAKEIRFTLKVPYGPFLENTSLGIMPKALWNESDSEQLAFSPLNTEPVGAGPYRMVKSEKSKTGVPTYYELRSFADYALGKPYIRTIKFRFYANEELLSNALVSGAIESAPSLSPQLVSELAKTLRDRTIMRESLPRIFALFFNQQEAGSLFTHKEVREALSLALPRQKIIENALLGYGTAIDSPVTADVLAPVPSDLSDEARLTAAKAVLEKAGWKLASSTGMYQKTVGKKVTDLSFAISTANTEELRAAAVVAKEAWTALGAAVEVKVFDGGDLNANIIRPRHFDVLLFGEIIGRDPDLFAYWHTSQRNDPGFNVTNYANSKVNRLTEEAREEADRTERLAKYRDAAIEIRKDAPAAFLYTPDFIYIVPDRIRGQKMGSISTAADRFMNIYNWHIETDHVWKLFLKYEDIRS
jgi:peptide/nickel transport system substrate-binding protein